MDIHGAHRYEISRGRDFPRRLITWRFEEKQTTAQVARHVGLEPPQARQLMIAELGREEALLASRRRVLEAEQSHATHQLTIDHIVQIVAKERGFSEAQITEPGRLKKRGDDEKFGQRVLARQIAIHLSNKLLKLPHQPLAVHFKIGISSVGLSIHSVEFRYNHDRTFKTLIDALAEKCLAAVKR